MLVLDYNEDRSLQTSSKKSKDTQSSNSTINFDTAIDSIQNAQAKVQINTLSPYVGFGGGIYMMYSVKKMTAKEDFLMMPLEDRNCNVELYEDCRTRELLKECKCLPLEMSSLKVTVQK